AEANSDLSQNHSLFKSDEENDDIDEVTKLIKGIITSINSLDLFKFISKVSADIIRFNGLIYQSDGRYICQVNTGASLSWEKKPGEYGRKEKPGNKSGIVGNRRLDCVEYLIRAAYP
uniref:Uncharacterized protein n=1 Tax=Romanomermis culicivorax TaxID=13658 RepID=A0A915L2J7_ROMCU